MTQGEKIKAIIKEQGRTISFVADKMGVSRQNLYMCFYSGRRLDSSLLLRLQEILKFNDAVLKDLMKEE